MSSAYLAMEFLAYVFIGYFETHKNHKNKKALLSLSIDLLKVLIFIFAFVVYLNKMGVSLQTVLTTIGIFGLGIALAAKDSMANFFGSLNILLDNTFSQGDIIKIGDLEGEVVNVGLRSTQIRSFDNSLILLPNAEVSIKPIINWSKREIGREIKTYLNISYDTHPDKIRLLIEELRHIISQHPDLVKVDDILDIEKKYDESIFISKRNLLGLKKDQFVYLDTFNATHLSIFIQTFSRTINREEWFKVKEDLFYLILETLEKHEIEFDIPSQNLFLKKEMEKEIR
jgi:MscS family membrane protein